MRGMSEDAIEGTGICRLWGAKAKASSPATGVQSGSDALRDLIGEAHPAVPPRPTRGHRIGAGTFVIPAHNNRFAPVVAAFRAKGTSMQTGGTRGESPFAAPHRACGCDKGGAALPKSRGQGGRGCGCGGARSQAGERP